MEAIAETQEAEEESKAATMDALFTMLQNSNNKNIDTLLDSHKKAMAALIQANKQDTTTLTDNITRNMTSILLARFPLNSHPPGFNGHINTNGNNGFHNNNIGSTSENISGIRAASINLKFPSFDGTDPT